MIINWQEWLKSYSNFFGLGGFCPDVVMKTLILQERGDPAPGEEGDRELAVQEGGVRGGDPEERGGGQGRPRQDP